MPFGGQYTWTTARDELARRLGNRQDTKLRIPEWMNEAQAAFASCYIDINDLETSAVLRTTPGVSEYDLTSTAPALTDIIGIQHVKNTTTGLRCARFPWDDYRRITSQARSGPCRWSRRGYVLAFDPQPDDNYEILVEYRKRPALDTLSLDTKWQGAWLKYAESIGWAAVQNHDRAKLLRMELPQVLTLMLETPLNQDQWEAMWDEDLKIQPVSWGSF